MGLGEKLEKYREAKNQKYRNLSEEQLIKKDLSKQRKIIKETAATSTACGSMWATGGVSAAAHGGLMFYHEGRAGKQAMKQQMTKDALDCNGWERKNPGAGQVLGDVMKGMANGGLGIAALEKMFDDK